MMAYLKRSLTLRLLAAYGSIILLSLAVSGIFSNIRVGRLVDKTIDAYGTTVASQVAHSSLDAVMQRDMIALQAQLANLLKTPGVISAVIYDAKGQLLAQAGATPSELKGHKYLHNYSATLALGDNMTGNVGITLETAEIEQVLPEARWALISTFALAVFLLLGVSRHFARTISNQKATLAQALLETAPPAVLEQFPAIKPGSISEEEIGAILQQLRQYVDEVQAPSPAALREAAAELLNSGGGRAYLLVECRNLDLLQRQVSRDRLRALLDTVQQQVEKTCTLYNAQRLPVTGSCIKIVVSAAAGQVADALIQAACCAKVLSGVLEQCRDEELGIQLQWRVVLDWHAPCDNDILRNRQQGHDEQRSQWLCRQIGSGQLAVSTEAGALLQEQDKLTLAVEHGEDGKPFYRVTGFVHTLMVLLEGQVTQLLED